MGTRSHWQDPPVERSASRAERSFDVVVVGGGIAGVGTAFWMRRQHPDLRVAVVERGRLAEGASGRNAGFLLQGADPDYATTVDRLGRETARRLWRLTLETRRQLVEAVRGADVGLEERGSYVAAGDEAENERLRRSESLLQEDGVDARYLSPTEAASQLGSRGLLGALFVPTGAVLHPVSAVRVLAARSGATVVEGAEVSAVTSGGGEVEVTTTRGTIRARHVVLALNAYLPRLLPDFEALVRPVRAQMLVTAPIERQLYAPVYSHGGYFYLRQLAGGEVVIGGARHLHVEAEVGYDDRTTPVLQDDLGRFLREYFPTLAGAEVIRRWSGTMGFSPDGLPMIGRVHSLREVWWVAGFTGHGMGYGFRTARTVAAAVLDLTDEYGDLLSVGRLARDASASEEPERPRQR